MLFGADLGCLLQVESMATRLSQSESRNAAAQAAFFTQVSSSIEALESQYRYLHTCK